MQRAFGQPLYDAALQLVDTGCVREVRVLQAGRVVTGIVSIDSAPAPVTQTARTGQSSVRATGEGIPGETGQSSVRATGEGIPRETGYRVYIRRANGNPDAAHAMEAECSCGERSPCIHVAAVSIAAAKDLSSSATDSRRASPSSPPQLVARGTPSELLQLCYLLEHPKDDPSARATRGGLRLSLWVGRKLTDSHGIEADSACTFLPRSADGQDSYPRYVIQQDQEILRALTAQHADGPWHLGYASGGSLLQKIASTGRAFWRSLHTSPLRLGAARRVHFQWTALPNGEQRLSSDSPASMSLLLDLEPPVYVDAAHSEWGFLDLPHAAAMLRQYWYRQPLPPEEVESVREQMANIPGDTSFPVPRSIPVESRPLRSLQAKLVLAAGPTATLYFVYNDLAVDSRALRADQDSVRILNGEILHEIPRDPDAEQQILAEAGRIPSRPDADTWLAFMMSTVPVLEAAGWHIVVEPGFPYRLVAAGDWHADLNAHGSGDWFDVRLGIVVDGQPINLLPALVGYLQATLDTSEGAVRRIGEHVLVRLDDGRHLPVPVERVQRIADTLVELFDRDALSEQRALRLPASQASRVAQLTHELHVPALQSNDPAMLALVEELASFSGIQPLPGPSSLRATLRSYQQEGLGWLQFLRRCRLGGILADDMGLGKTVQTLAHLLLEKEQGRLLRPALIVAPVSVIGNWQQEIRRLAPGLRLVTLHGNGRKALFADIDTADVVLTGYSLLQLDFEVLAARQFSFLILDEAQMIKNPRAKVSQAARALRADHRLCLTGTPMENHLGELWSLFEFAQPRLLGNEQQFQRHYRGPVEKDGDGRRARALAERIAPFVLRRTKDNVARELPPKTQIVESIAMDERQRDFYDGIRLAMHQRVREVIEQQGLARSQITVLDALLKLRQACCDPRLIEEDAQARAIPSAKMDWLNTALPELVAEGRRILLFSQFTSMLRLIEAAVAQLGIPCLMLTGATQHRTELVERFQSGAVPLFLISLKAGGTGLNLTAADTVIHYDPWWNPAAEAQATDRAHRIGQEQPVFVYKLITQGTVEERIMQLQEDKQALASQLYTEKSASPARLSAADLETLFAP